MADHYGNGNRYSDEEKKAILIFLARYGVSDETMSRLKTELKLTSLPNISTIRSRWVPRLTQSHRLQTWLDEAKQNGEGDYSGIDQWIRKVKNIPDRPCLSFRSFFKCFRQSLSVAQRDIIPDNTENEMTLNSGMAAIRSCSTYHAFLECLLQTSCDIGEREMKSIQDQLRIRPYRREVLSIFGSNHSLSDEVSQELTTLVAEDMNTVQQQNLSVALCDYIDSIDEDELSVTSRRYLDMLYTSYQRSRQIGILIAYAKAICVCILWDERWMVADVRLSDEVVKIVNQMAMPHSYVSEFLTLALTEGIYGRMGTHGLLYMAERESAMNPIAAYEIGDRYYYGSMSKTHQPDYDKAFEYYQKAANMNHAVAIWACGYMLVRNLGSYAKSFDRDETRFAKARSYFEWGKELGSSACINAMGQLYLRGQIVDNQGHFRPRDLDMAKKFLDQSISMGYFYSYNARGQVYELKAQAASTNKERDQFYRWAFDEYLEASKYSDGYSRNRLGFITEHGYGRKADSDEAASWYLKSLNVLDADIERWSYFNVARVYDGSLSNQQVPIDRIKASEHYLLACSLLEPDHYYRIIPPLLLNIIKISDDIILEKYLQLARDTERFVHIYLDNAQLKSLHGQEVHAFTLVEQRFTEFQEVLTAKRSAFRAIADENSAQNSSVH